MGVGTLSQLLRPYRVIALDTVIFIYHFEDNVTYAPLTQLIFERVETGAVEAVASVMTVAEVLTGAKKVGDANLVLHYRALFATYPHLSIAPVDMQIAEKASDLRASYGLRMPDAITAASAIVCGAQALITNDRALKRVSEIDVVLLMDMTA